MVLSMTSHRVHEVKNTKAPTASYFNATASLAALICRSGQSRFFHADGHDIRVIVLLVADRGREVPQQPERHFLLDLDKSLVARAPSSAIRS